MPHAGRRFAAGRAALRRILAARTGAAPESLVIQYGRFGKPFLVGGPEFSLSHSGPLALLAVAEAPIGIDVEAIRPLEDGVARLVFSPAEQAYLDGLPQDARQAAFYSGWTRKEAVIKAQGGTLGDLQDTIVLPRAPRGWTVAAVAVPPGYAAAVAAEGCGWIIDQRDPQSASGVPPEKDLPH